MVYVVVEVPYHDGSGKAGVLGVFSTMEKAEALVGRLFLDEQSRQPLVITEHVVDGGVAS
jgi:hypothetical protein